MFTNNGYCQLLMFCCHCLPCISPFHKNLRSQILVPSPYLPAFSVIVKTNGSVAALVVTVHTGAVFAEAGGGVPCSYSLLFKPQTRSSSGTQEMAHSCCSDTVFVHYSPPPLSRQPGNVDCIWSSAANRLIGEVVQSRRRPLLGPSPG